MSSVHNKQRRLHWTAIVLVLALTLVCGIFVPLLSDNAMWRWIFSYLFSVNMVTWIYFIYDKTISVDKNRVRVPENTFHILAVFGGLPSTIVAMYTINHKRSKFTFKRNLFVWLLISGTLIAVILWLFFGR